MEDRAYLSIGEVLSLLKEEFPDVTISKIRFLESQGLLDPERTPSGYRKFYETDVERLRWILRQQREHFLPLKVIKGRLRGGPDGGGEDSGDEGSPASVDGVGRRPPTACPPTTPARGGPAPAPGRRRRRDGSVPGCRAPAPAPGARSGHGRHVGRGPGAGHHGGRLVVPRLGRLPRPAPAAHRAHRRQPHPGRAGRRHRPRRRAAQGAGEVRPPVGAQGGVGHLLRRGRPQRGPRWPPGS